MQCIIKWFKFWNMKRPGEQQISKCRITRQDWAMEIGSENSSRHCTLGATKAVADSLGHERQWFNAST